MRTARSADEEQGGGKMNCTHHWTVTSECPMCLRAQVERLKVVVESRDAAVACLEADVECLRAEVDTAYRQMNEAIDTAREAQAELAALLASRDDDVGELRAEVERWKNEAFQMAAHQGIDNYQRLLSEIERLTKAHKHQYDMAGLMLREAERAEAEVEAQAGRLRDAERTLRRIYLGDYIEKGYAPTWDDEHNPALIARACLARIGKVPE